MIFRSLKLAQFRCYENAEVSFDSLINVVTGLNGQGKTSILEALGLAAFLKSFRNSKNSEMTRLGSSESLVSAFLESRGLDYQLNVRLSNGRKQAFINGKPCRFLSEYVGKTSAVSFSPSDLEIVRGAPENRRSWIDKVSLIYDPSHADNVSRYAKILEQRNRILKAYSEGKLSTLPDDFSTWTEELISWGAKVIHNRIHSVDNSVDKVGHFYGQISGTECRIELRYFSEILNEFGDRQESSGSLELISHALKKGLEKYSQKEKILGSTLVGPHRDDLHLLMDANEAKAFGSQGEIRSLVLAMRLAEVEAYKDAQNLKPVLLIDDFSSELDSQRRGYLLEYLVKSESQVFLSTTEELNLGKVFRVNEGRIVADGSEREYELRF